MPPKSAPRPSNASRPNGDKPEHEILFQQFFKSANPQRTYAAQLKRASNGNHYLVLTEGSSSDGKGGSSVLPIVYRISIRVDGPRGSQSFYQTTFTM